MRWMDEREGVSARKKRERERHKSAQREMHPPMDKSLFSWTTP